MRHTIIVCLLLLMFMLNGCIFMTAQHKEAVFKSAILTEQLNVKCQAGDDVACKEGLNEASATLKAIVEATK